MATVKPFIRTSTSSKEKKVKVRFRLTDGREIQLFHTSEIEVKPSDWDPKKFCIKPKVIYGKKEREEFDKSVSDRMKLIQDLYYKVPDTNKESLTSEWLDREIEKFSNPPVIEETKKEKTFIDYFEEYVSEYRGTDRMKQHYNAVKRMIQRYELYKQKEEQSFTLTFDIFSPTLLRDFERFLQEEHKLFKKYPDIYEAVPDTRTPKERGGNRINKILQYIRTVLKWAERNDYTKNNPFKTYKIGESIYGTPYYISIKERNDLLKFDFSETPLLAEQRDIFVFQCLIGCRVGDLVKFTKNSVISDAVEYIPRKTKEERPITLRVPLNKIAKEIVDRYAGNPGDKLLPFILEQDYNEAIKTIFALAGLTRQVTVINPLTRKEEKKPLNEIASSHLARRTFIGNLYKKVKDPNLVGALSGHKEGSRAFARYRDIDEKMKIDLVKMLE